MKIKLFVLVAALAVTFAACVPTNPPTRNHFTVNDARLSTSAGFNILDSGPDPATVNSLPDGTKAMVYVGNLDNQNCDAGYTTSDFQARVDALAGNPKVYGFYISDEPHVTTCSSAANDIRYRADYVHAHAPGTKAFIVILNSSNDCGAVVDCEFAALKPSITHVDLVGVDPYPCHLTAPCDFDKINQRVGLALNAGIPQAAIVPTFQAFGQGASGYYRLPTPTEFQTMLDRWDTLVPNPELDYSYTWGAQPSSPQALSNSPELQTVINAHNRRP